MTVSLQRLHHAGQCRLQSLATDPVRCLPYYDQRLSDSLVVDAPALGTLRPVDGSCSPRSLTACFRWQPVRATNSLSIRLLSLFDASLYRLRIAPSTSVLVAVLISVTISMLRGLGNTIMRQRPDFGNIYVRQ